MGRRDRERLQKILSGEEKPIRHEKLVNMVVSVLQRQSTDKQIDFLNTAVGEGRLKQSKLRDQLEKNAPIEMRKGIEKLIKKGKVPTVDLLLEEYRREKSFQKLAGSVGLDEAWFIKLAEDEIAKRR
jgi:hypothetical protein